MAYRPEAVLFHLSNAVVHFDLFSVPHYVSHNSELIHHIVRMQSVD